MKYNSKLRVAELIRDAKGGMKEHYLALVKGLLDSGIDIIALGKFSPKERHELEKWGAIVVSFVIRDRIKPIRDVFAIARLTRILKKYKVDIVHCHGFRAGMIGRVAAFLVKCRCIYTIHNFLPMNLGKIGRRITGWTEGKLFAITETIIAVSKALKEEISRIFSIDSCRVKVIYNGIDPPNVSDGGNFIKKRWGIDKEEKVIGTVARLIPSKGIDVLLDAIPLVIRENAEVKFMIVGDGPEESILKKKAELLNCSENIIFTGYSEYIWYYYEAFDIFVLPSLSEGLGISILEAMAMGKPVIASRTGGIEEIIKHDWNGYLVPPKDSKELADAILYCLSNPGQTQDYADRGKREIDQKFHLENMIKKTLGVILQTNNE